MPLYKEWKSDEYSLSAIWKIEEPESFFVERTGMASDIKNDKRRIERLAGRFLLRHLKEDFPLFNIHPDEHDKPRVDDNFYYFSISHSWPYVAAMVSPDVEAGVDIQVWHPNIERIQHKFLSEEELLFTQNNSKLTTLAWCAKEAAYKWQGRRGVEFLDHLIINNLEKKGAEYVLDIYCPLTINNLTCNITGVIETDFAFAQVKHESVVHPF